jgi:hypothetical protein
VDERTHWLKALGHAGWSLPDAWGEDDGPSVAA